MKPIKRSLIINKKSKFYGYLFRITSVEEIEDILCLLKKENKHAKHIVYAYKLNNIEKKCDDKEPSGTAGKPILDIINFKNENNILIVIIRFFGGTLLGRGLLTRSYAEATNELFK